MTDQDSQAMDTAYLALGRLIAAECPVGFETASLRMETHEPGAQLWIAAALPDGTNVKMQPGADAARRMPQRDGDAGPQQRAHAIALVADEIIAGHEKDIDDFRIGHGGRYAFL